MYKLISIRGKGGSTTYEDKQMELIEEQRILDAKLEGIDLEFYEMRQENKRQYEETFRPMEEDLLKRAAGPAREATSAEARAGEYAASNEASMEALQRKNERMGISNDASAGSGDDDYIRAIALTAVGNQSKMSALETQSNLKSASIGIGVGVNQDIGRAFGGAVTGMNQSIGHADAAMANYSNAQGHMNNAYAAQQQGYGALIQTGASVAGMGLSNYQNAQRSAALSSNPTDSANWKSAFSGSAYSPSPNPINYGSINSGGWQA